VVYIFSTLGSKSSHSFPCFTVRWILNFVDQPFHENHENWYPRNKGDFTVYYGQYYCSLDVTRVQV